MRQFFGAVTPIIEAAEETEDGNGIYVVYTIRSSGMNSEGVISALNMGTSSAAVTQALKQAGFTDVRMYFGSWNEWSRDDTLPIETAAPIIKARAPVLAMAA